MKSILESIRENVVNEGCGYSYGGCGLSSSSSSYGGSRFSKFFSESDGNYFISNSSPEYLQGLIVYIADNGKVSPRLRSDASKARQQGIIDLCKDIKKKMKW